MKRYNYTNKSMMNRKYFLGSSQQRGAFTLTEVMVAVGIFMLLMVIILVPLNMAINMLHMSKTQVEVQTATQRAIDQMRDDLTKAIMVYPNEVGGPTSSRPYHLNQTHPEYYEPYYQAEFPPGSGTPGPEYYPGHPSQQAPYFRLPGVDAVNEAPTDVCTPLTAPEGKRVENITRIDMLVPQTHNGILITPLRPAPYIVSYYMRRRKMLTDPSDPSSAPVPYQAIDNPIVLFRAQMPYGDGNGNLIDPNGNPVAAPFDPTSQDLNVDNSDGRYGTWGTTCTATGSGWLAESENGEPNLEPYTQGTNAAPFNRYASHVNLLPQDMGLITGKAYNQPADPAELFVKPRSTFVLRDTNSDGKIDRVTITLLIDKVDEMGAEPRGQSSIMPQVIDLPNIRK